MILLFYLLGWGIGFYTGYQVAKFNFTRVVAPARTRTEDLYPKN